MTACPRCRAPVASGQEYCLECGARLEGSAFGGRGRRTSGWIVRIIVAALVALAGAAAAVAASTSAGSGAEIVTAIGGFASAPSTSTATDEPVPSGVADWPSGEDGWTVVLASLPQTGGRPPALARARVARKRHLPQVGILDSSRYASLHPGYWIVFTGVYSSEAEATSALESARKVARGAVVRRVVP